MTLERRRLPHALLLSLLLSLLIHAMLLTVTFSGQGHWLLSFAFPWQDRRVEVPALHVALVPAQIPAAVPPVTPPAPPPATPPRAASGNAACAASTAGIGRTAHYP